MGYISSFALGNIVNRAAPPRYSSELKDIGRKETPSGRDSLEEPGDSPASLELEILRPYIFGAMLNPQDHYPV